MGKVFLEGYLEVPPDRIAAVREALPAHIELTRAEPGCISFTVEQSADDSTRFLVSEIFADQRAFEGHQQRMQTSTWASVTAGLARHYSIRTE